MTVGVSNDPAPVVALEHAASAIATARRAALADRYAASRAGTSNGAAPCAPRSRTATSPIPSRSNGAR